MDSFSCQITCYSLIAIFWSWGSQWWLRRVGCDAYPSHACVMTVSVDLVSVLLMYRYYQGRSSANWCCDTHSIWNPFSGFAYTMKNYLSAREMADTHIIYGCTNGDSREARHLYAERYLQHRIPSPKLQTKLHQRLGESGFFTWRVLDCGKPRSVQTADTEVTVLRSVEDDPWVTVRRIAVCPENSPRTITLPMPHPASAKFSLLLIFLQGWYFANGFS
jgi:hypothetical protein